MKSYPIIIGACTHNKDNNKQSEDTDAMMNIAVDCYTNLNAVNNGGHSSSLEYQVTYKDNIFIPW